MMLMCFMRNPPCVLLIVRHTHAEYREHVQLYTLHQQQRHAGGNTPPDLVRRRGKMTTERKSSVTEVRAALDRYGVEDSGHRHLHKAVDMVLKTFPHLPFGRVREELKIVLKNRRYEKRTRKARKAPPTTASLALKVRVTRLNGTLLVVTEERGRQGTAESCDLRGWSISHQRTPQQKHDRAHVDYLKNALLAADGNSTSQKSFHQFFSEGKVMFCGGHVGRAHDNKMAGWKTFSNGFEQKHPNYESLTKLKCHCTGTKHSPTCGCLTPTMIKQANTNHFSALVESGKDHEFSLTYAKTMSILGTHHAKNIYSKYGAGYHWVTGVQVDGAPSMIKEEDKNVAVRPRTRRRQWRPRCVCLHRRGAYYKADSYIYTSPETMKEKHCAKSFMGMKKPGISPSVEGQSMAATLKSRLHLKAIQTTLIGKDAIRWCCKQLWTTAPDSLTSMLDGPAVFTFGRVREELKIVLKNRRYEKRTRKARCFDVATYYFLAALVHSLRRLFGGKVQRGSRGVYERTPSATTKHINTTQDKRTYCQRTVRGGRLLLIALLPPRLSRDSYRTGEVVMASRPVRLISGAGQSVVCPYDHSHIVQSNRLLRHILKCRKNYTGPDLAVCRYSAVHIMRPAEIALHEASCPYGRKVGERSKSAVIHVDIEFGVKFGAQANFRAPLMLKSQRAAGEEETKLRERAAEHAANVRKKEEQMATQSPTLLQEHGGPVSSEASCRDFLKQVSALPKVKQNEILRKQIQYIKANNRKQRSAAAKKTPSTTAPVQRVRVTRPNGTLWPWRRSGDAREKQVPGDITIDLRHDGVTIRDVQMTGCDREPPGEWPMRPMITFVRCDEGYSCHTINTCVDAAPSGTPGQTVHIPSYFLNKDWPSVHSYLHVSHRYVDHLSYEPSSINAQRTLCFRRDMFRRPQAFPGLWQEPIPSLVSEAAGKRETHTNPKESRIRTKGMTWRITYDEDNWAEMKTALDDFFFDHFLPLIYSTSPRFQQYKKLWNETARDPATQRMTSGVMQATVNNRWKKIKTASTATPLLDKLPELKAQVVAGKQHLVEAQLARLKSNPNDLKKVVSTVRSMCHYSGTIIYPIKLEYLSTLHSSRNRPGQKIRACYVMSITTEEARAATHEEVTSPGLDLTYVKFVFWECGDQPRKKRRR
ncbi:hypothetical protein Bbelb_050510 [Branchiostoma belcheri]|nr:hypothetical protein Bbelb_050510 [Branchiostoma belcheri]